VAPQRIERILRTSPFIAQAVAYGDKRKYLTALITLDPDGIARWAADHGLDGVAPAQLAARPEVHELITREVEQCNRQLASFETVKRFHILPRDFSIEDGEMTPTLKIKRKVVVQRYQKELDALYTD
jgi:long-chain acyl-CoA synthetase